MPQLNAIVLKDMSNDDRTFSPDNVSNGIATLVESNGVPIAASRLTMSKSSTPAGRQKVTIKLAIPVVQNTVVNGVSKPTVVRTGYADLTFSTDGTASKEERDDLRMMVYGLMANYSVSELVSDLRAFY